MNRGMGHASFTAVGPYNNIHISIVALEMGSNTKNTQKKEERKQEHPGSYLKKIRNDHVALQV